MAEKLIYESSNSQIYVLNDEEWQKPVIRKTLNNEYPPPAEIARFYNEFDIISGLNLKGVRQVLKRGRFKRKPALYLDYIDAQTLSEAFHGKENDIEDFLHIAIAIAQAIGEIHQQNIIHKDISAANILVNLQDRTVKIIDFGISSKINLKKPHLGNPERLEGNLSYISPEQTGRMNRVVDHRTDLYSMGILFYEMLSGSLPFIAEDAMGLVHAHIAQQAEPLHLKNNHIPEIISQIVTKLLEKSADDRYQSAFGVVDDLKRCLKQLTNSGKIELFELASNDFSGKFQIPQKLYGREQETTALMQSFEQATQGQLKMMLVAGYSGTGKSALVHEIHKPITQKRGYFIEGKFDQFQRNLPYFAILQAFENYINLRLTESKQQLNELRILIQEAVGTEGKVITDVIPNLVHIIGEQPDVAEVGGNETQNRFNYIFAKFVKAISTKDHPITLFIDDLQWADVASLNLLKVLMNDSDNGYLLCIGAYRDNEVNQSHPFMIAINEISEAGVDIDRIEIGNLSEPDVKNLIADAIARSPDAVSDLTKLVYSKTHGNAFFVTQFLNKLYQDNLLAFDFDKKTWQWDLSKITSMNITDNVVELMAGKIKKLPADTQQAMKYAACIGNSFDINTLSIIRKKTSDEVLSELQAGLAESLLVPADQHYKFAHDRIQQAVYSLIPEQERKHVHLAIGQLLLESLTDEEQEKRLFDIVNQWNLGKEMISDATQKLQLAELNLNAGNKAKQASAFKPAYEYLQTGIELLEKDHWQLHYELSRDLYTRAAETAYLNGDFAQMEQKIETALENASDLLDKVVPYEIRILAYKAKNRLLDAINTGLDVLGELGEDFPRKASMTHVMLDLLKTKYCLRGKNLKYLSNLPEMTEQRKIAAMRIIAGIASSSYWATPALFPLLIFRMCQLSIKYGNTALSAFGFATYGVIMCGVLGAMKSGYEYGKLGLVLLDKFDARAWLTQIYTPIYALINNWNEHVENTLQPFQASYHIGLETGAIEFSCINANIYCIHAFLTGRQLEKIEAETQAYSDSFKHYKQETNYNYNQVYHQAMLNFMGRSENPLILTGSAYDEATMMQQNLDRNDQTGKFFIHFNKLILCYYFQDFSQAKQHADESRKLLEAVLAKFEIPNHHFYESLVLLALYSKANRQEKLKTMFRVRANMLKIKKWAKYAPENYAHKYFLIDAERLRVLGKNNLARNIYDKAIEAASNNRYIHEEALAYEVTGRFYAQQKAENLAEYHLKAAYNSYREWGAKAKLADLGQRYPQIISSTSSQNIGLNTTTSVTEISSSTDKSMLDLITLHKASTAISGEIVLRNLLQLLMKIVIENAGAQRGYLLLEKNGKLQVQAEYDVDLKQMYVLQGKPAEETRKMASRIVQYVYRTKENVVLHDATNDERYAQDDYIIAHKPKSILVMPIVNQGKFVGILYLENNLSVGAFTQNRIDTLCILSGQIAVSIDNAMLYENLEQKVVERTEELALEKQKSEELLRNILPAETAEELKQYGKAEPKSYDNVTVMFTDFKGFTQFAGQLPVNELVNEINTCFSAFDQIMEAHGVEKIKTIGDAYMCVGGLPVANSTHAMDTVRAALAVQRWMAEHKKQRQAENLPFFDIRIGLHSGPLIAGVVGTHKFAYDIWGETVNIAARMEAGSEAGMVNISGATYALIKDQFECSYRGKLPAKNMSDIDMFFVNKLLPLRETG